MTQKTNEHTNKATSGTQGNQASQMGGKTSPAGGPETFESDQVNQGRGSGSKAGQDRTTQGGNQAGRGDPYPPVNPDRPVMAGGQQGRSQGAPAKGGDFGSRAGIGGGTGNVALEEEE